MSLVITRREELKKFILDKKQHKNSIGFVPTMGALHNGHAKLIQKSLAENDLSVVSIFVNPTQFSPNEDLSKYPRQFEKDFQFCKQLGVDVIFTPTVQEMYPTEFSTQVSVKNLNHFMCGQFRPGHFDGVATVVLMLLNIVQPHKLYLGQKDFQQVQVIRQMLSDLSNNTEVVIIPTLREPSGLALSSRNAYLTPDAKSLASSIALSLALGAKAYLQGERSSEVILQIVLSSLQKNNLTPQYLELRSTHNLALSIKENIEEECVLAIAVVMSQCNNVRLIDNIILSDKAPWVDVLSEFIEIVE